MKKLNSTSTMTALFVIATFGVLVFAVILIIAALAFFPALTLAPLAEYFSM